MRKVVDPEAPAAAKIIRGANRRKNEKRWRERNPEKVKAKNDAYRATHQEYFRKGATVYNGRPDVKDRRKNAKLLKNYGITLAEYQEMLDSQGGVCAICQEPDKRGTKLAVDHDHLTLKNRGLLCRQCNLAVGNLRDSPDIAKAATQYLEQHNPAKPEYMWL